jgi:hypothetical protein
MVIFPLDEGGKKKVASVNSVITMIFIIGISLAKNMPSVWQMTGR